MSGVLARVPVYLHHDIVTGRIDGRIDGESLTEAGNWPAGDRTWTGGQSVRLPDA